MKLSPNEKKLARLEYYKIKVSILNSDEKAYFAVQIICLFSILTLLFIDGGISLFVSIFLLIIQITALFISNKANQIKSKYLGLYLEEISN